MELGNPKRIQVLPEHLANKIAAGEVIQRPESVVKELLENAVDAQASKITVTVKEGGTSFIQVSDNGTGMDSEDAVSAFLRHATSKISTYEDLEAISTFGFRGEALASIAAVAQVSLKTRRSSDDTATMVRIDGGGKPRVSREARERGSTITVQNLFFNVPARKKFLKSHATEFRHVYEAVHRVAISYPEIELQFVADDGIVFSLKPSSLQQRLMDIFGQRVVESLIPVEEKTDALTITGFIGKPAFGQKTRSHQYLFLNRRYIIHRNISHAIFSGYEHLLLKGTFPFFLLFIEIDPHQVDVNVHPSKMEAKFSDEHALYHMAGALVRRALSTAQAVPSLGAEGGGNDIDVGLAFTPRQHEWEPGGRAWPRGESVDTATGEIFSGGAGGSGVAARLLGGPGSAEPRMPEGQILHHESERPDSSSSGLIWQLHNKYILCQIRSGVMIVDQHVAHERVLYEKVVERFTSGIQTVQQLLFPITLEFTAGDYATLTELLPHFQSLGFDIHLFGKHTAVVEGVPPDLKTGNEERIVQDVLGLYKEYQQRGISDARDSLAKSYSCRSAIKAGDPMTEPEMRSLIDQLFATSMPYVCPHGRPIVLRISIDELDRRFGRI
ncbi:MAG: DNA mismatch repair endonuclease MutL [Bacteroidota bacterium]